MLSEASSELLSQAAVGPARDQANVFSTAIN